jgi:hypothetical protein
MNGRGLGVADTRMDFEKVHAGGKAPLGKIREHKLYQCKIVWSSTCLATSLRVKMWRGLHEQLEHGFGSLDRTAGSVRGEFVIKCVKMKVLNKSEGR